jgi:ParB-like chromosome segregation protein Spo0J
MKNENLTPEEIYLKDERFRISYYFSVERLMNSLREIGLLNPPLVTVRNGHFILVTGWKRVLACLQLAFSSIPVKVSEEKDDLQNFLIAIHENLATRDFSLIEKAEIIRKLESFGIKKNQIMRSYLPLLDIPADSSVYEKYLALAGFAPKLKKVIHEKNIPFSVLQAWSELKPGARKLVMPILMPLGQNKQKEILEDLQEISQRENIAVEGILKAVEIRHIQSSEKLSPLQKADKIRALLHKRRYPSFSSWKESFDSSLRKMHWPKEIALKHSPFFEDEDIAVTFSFKNKKEFEENISKLKQMASKKEFSKLFR